MESSVENYNMLGERPRFWLCGVANKNTPYLPNHDINVIGNQITDGQPNPNSWMAQIWLEKVYINNF